MNSVLPPAQRQAIDRILEHPPLRAAMSTACEDMADIIEGLLVEHGSTLFAMLGADGLDALEAVFVGWALGFGVAHQDQVAREARIQELLAIIQHAAAQSSAFSAEITRRSVH